MTDDETRTGAGDPERDHDSLERAFQARLRSVKSVTERRTIAGLARELGSLPSDAALAALEISASIAAVSLRASIEFLRAAVKVARSLELTELRAWGEMGRRLAMGDVETAVTFFAEGVGDLLRVPLEARPLVFQICSRQMTLSSSVALETFKRAPTLVDYVPDAALLRSTFEVAAEISKRSAKHSADFLKATPRLIRRMRDFGADGPTIFAATVGLASSFAARAGGIASDAWTALPAALAGQTTESALLLLRRAGDFLERGGGAALHVLLAGGEVLRTIPKAFESWIDLLWIVAEHGNANLIAFVRAGPSFFQSLAEDTERGNQLALRIIKATVDVARVDGESALECFRSSQAALKVVSIEQFEQWARDGLSAERADPRARRSYYALETRRSSEALHTGGSGLSLEKIQHLLSLYVEALTGRSVEIAPLASFTDQLRINDGRTIHLPAHVDEFGDELLDFRLYKVLAAHAAGQIEFGTHEPGTSGLRAAFTALAELYADENLDARDAFSLDGYINELTKSQTANPPEEEARIADRARRPLPPDSDYRAVLAVFPQKGLAYRIFGTLENGRIDRRLRQTYRGLSRDLDLTRDHLRKHRPRIIDLPPALVPFELLFQITLCGGALEDSRQFYGQIVSEVETIVLDYLSDQHADVADTLMATSRVYSLFQSISPEQSQQQAETTEEDADSDLGDSSMEMSDQASKPERDSQQTDARELFNAWNKMEPEGEPDELDGVESWTHGEIPEQGLEEGEVAYNYDEWDRDLTDHRLGWCRVIEKHVRTGERIFVEQTRERHRGVISSIRHQFQLMKPENLLRVANEIDGEDYDLNAVIDYIIDRRADGHQSERLYTKRLRRRRDVTVSFLLDQSSSTARTIGRHPLQPYTHPGRRIIEIEKEGLVLMSEALEAVGDCYSINGFTSEGRRNVKFYVVKDFNERYSEEIERRIGGITYQNNTRLGAAIRHAASRLAQQEARTRLLIVLSDGRPYDHDYGDARYAREDTREALRQAKLQGITPFCITIDRESESELRDLYGDIGYTIIDDVMSLPERMPGIYRRLTT